MNKIIIYIVSILILSSISCSKQTNCAAFKNEDLRYIPYNISDTLTFENQDGEIFEIFINSIEKSEASSFTCRDLYGVCPCVDYVKLISKDSKNPNSYVFLKMEQSDVSAMQYFKYQVIDYNFEFDFRNELSEVSYFNNIILKDTVVIKNKSYSKVLIIKNTDNPKSSISQVYFNEKNGILKFVEKVTGSEWELIN